MSRRFVNNAILALVIILTSISLIISLANVNQAVVSSRILELVAYALVTAFALILSVPLSRSQLSIAHAIGLMALLSLPADVVPAMTIAIFIGGIIGGVMRSRLDQQNRRYDSPPWYVTTIHTSSRVTLAYFIASYVYINLFAAPLPITTNLNIRALTVPLAMTIFAYLLVYGISFVIQVRTYTNARRVVAENISYLLIILILPVPFALLGASAAKTDESLLFFSITMVGTILTIFGLFVLNQTQQRLHRQLEEMRSISVATQAMRGNLDLDGLLRTTYVQVSQLLDTKNFTVVLYDEIDMQMNFPLVIREGVEVTVTESDDLPPDYPLIDHIMDTGLGLLIDTDVNNRARELGLAPIGKPVSSWLGMPLVSGDKPIGAFVVQSNDQRRFDDDDLRVLNIIVASTSIAIENARLYRQKSTRAEQLATLNQVTSLLTGTLAPNEVLDTVVSSASTIAESDAVSVYLFDTYDPKQVVLARNAGLSDDFIRQAATPLLTAKMVNQGIDEYLTPESLLIKNLDDEQAQSVRQQMISEEKSAFIEHPLVFAGRNLGILVVYYNNAQIYHPEQIDMIQAFATQAAQAINNAQRFETADKALEQRVEQLYVLAAMGRLLNASMETDKIYEIVLTYATDATNAPRGYIAIKRSNNSLFVPAQVGYPPTMFEDADYLQQGLSGRVLNSGQALRISDTRLETGYLPLIPQTRSMLITPIMKGRDVLGIIMMESDSPSAFSEGDGHFVAQILNQAVIAADNTQLFQRIREARDNMQVILDAMQEGVILFDEQAVVTQTNPRISLIELSADDIINQSVTSLLENDALRFAELLGFSNPQALQKIVTNFNKEWENHPLHDYEIHDESFGIRYIQRQIIPVRDDNQRVSGVMLVFYNKSEEHELAAQRQSLSQMIVHDLRSPLTAVTTSMRLLQELVPQESNFAPLVEKTTTAGRRAIRKVLARVDSLLDISKMESGEMNLERESSSIQHIIDNVKAVLDPLALEHEVEIVAETTQSIPRLNIDADKIERMVLNLVDNAIKYSPRNGRVVMRAVLADDLTMVRVEVADSGPGIPDDYKKRLFDRYVQIEGRKTVRRGVGLGLTFCKLVTEAHGGTIWVTDNPSGDGSVFNATLPTMSG